MLMIKYIILTMLLVATSYGGIIIAKKYQNRVMELKEMKAKLNIFLTKIKLTYEPIPQIFDEIGKQGNSNINELFKIASKKMEDTSAGEAWLQAIETRKYKLKKGRLRSIKRFKQSTWKSRYRRANK